MTTRYRTRHRGGIPGPELDDWQEFALLHPRRGTGPLSLEAIFGPEWEAIVPELWEIHGEGLTAKWIADSLRRGSGISRPALWWAFDGPDEGRRVINPPAPEVEARWRAENTWFGRMVGAGIYHGEPPGWWLEFEREYLARHGLLTAEERAALRLDPRGESTVRSVGQA